MGTGIVTWGTDPKAKTISVYYEGSSTIYEGMPVCYNYDTTDNWMGVASIDATSTASSITESGTTAESAGNEGKFIRVEDPADNNLTSFAGVVANGSWVGTTGPAQVDIFIPNGAIVPCRCDVDTTVGVTILAVTVASQELGQPVQGSSRPVGIAAETETGLDSTAGTTLVKLDPNLFLYNNLDGTALSVGAGTSSLVVNEINCTSAQTSGNFTALYITAASTAGAAANGYGLALYAQADVSATPSSHLTASSHWMNVTGGSPAGGIQLVVLEAGMWESGATLTNVGLVTPLKLTTNLDNTNAPGANTHFMMYLRADGSDKPDGMFCAYRGDSINMISTVAASTTFVIPFYVEASAGGVAAGTYYIPVSSTR